MRYFLALVVCKLMYHVLRLFGRGSNLPGEYALKICPGLLGKLKPTGKIIAITGSNGKTTTAGMVTHILQSAGYSAVYNPEGSNMTGGVATTMLRSAGFSRKIKKDFIVLEVDERFSRLIFKDFQPDYMLVTNLFRDQVTRNNNVDFIFDILNNTLKPSVKLVLNALDPISGRLCANNDRVYYGAAEGSYTTSDSNTITHDAKVCPACKHRLGYDYFLYNHIGVFACQNCGYHSPEPKYVMSEADFITGGFLLNGLRVESGYASLYQYMNMTAAAAVCSEVGIPLEKAVDALNTLVINHTRYEQFEVGGRQGVMILSKNQNPVSFDLSLSQVLLMEGEKTIVAYINNINHTYHKDTTWLWDISFERLADKGIHVVCAGPRGWDLAVRLQYAGFDMEKVHVATKIEDVGEAIEKTAGTLCVLTELYDAKLITSAVAKSNSDNKGGKPDEKHKTPMHV